MTYTLTCQGCGKPVTRKIRIKEPKCKECKSKRMREYFRKWKAGNMDYKPKPFLGGPSFCNNCHHLPACRRDVNCVAVVPNEGLVMMPLPCFADHPHYNPKEWRQRQEI